MGHSLRITSSPFFLQEGASQTPALRGPVHMAGVSGRCPLASGRAVTQQTAGGVHWHSGHDPCNSARNFLLNLTFHLYATLYYYILYKYFKCQSTNVHKGQVNGAGSSNYFSGSPPTLAPAVKTSVLTSTLSSNGRVYSWSYPGT